MKNIKDLGSFAVYVSEHLFDANEEMAGNCQVRIHEVKKNNGKVLTGITIKDDSCNLAPTIYLNGLYEKYLEGTSIDELLEDIIDTYKAHQPKENFNIEFFKNWEKVKGRLTMKLVNAAKNESLLAEVPHIQLADLAVIFQVKVGEFDDGNATITVRNEHMNMWGVEESTLYEAAKEQAEEFEIKSILEVLYGMVGEDLGDMFDESPLWVMSNKSKINGAVGMLRSDILQSFADSHETSFYIIPSSIHELILVPDKGEMSIEMLEDMVKEVNSTEVAPEEVLSDSVYFFNRETSSLSIASTGELLQVAA